MSRHILVLKNTSSGNKLSQTLALSIRPWHNATLCVIPVLLQFHIDYRFYNQSILCSLACYREIIQSYLCIPTAVIPSNTSSLESTPFLYPSEVQGSSLYCYGKRHCKAYHPTVESEYVNHLKGSRLEHVR